MPDSAYYYTIIGVKKIEKSPIDKNAVAKVKLPRYSHIS